MDRKDNTKYGHLAREIPIRDHVGSFDKGAVLDKDFFGWDSFSLRYGLVGRTGMIEEESDKLHTHDYDQLIWFLSADPDDMLELGAEIELDVGPGGVRQRISTPSVMILPAGTPHFSPIVTRLDRKFYFVSINCTGTLKADVFDEAARPGEPFGAWGEFHNPYKKNIQSLKFARKGAYHYGSAMDTDAGGIYAHINSSITHIPMPVTMTWQTVTKPHQLGPRQPDLTFAPHVHGYDEALIFLGLDQDDLTELHATATFGFGEEGVDQELFTVKKAAAMVLPAGVYHLPLIFREIEKPLIFISLSANTIFIAPKSDGM